VLDPVYTIQPVVTPVEQPDEQPAASCEQTFNRLSNRFDNRLYRVNGVLGISCSSSKRTHLYLITSFRLLS